MKKAVKWVGNAVCAGSILFVLSAFLRMDVKTAMGGHAKLLVPACAAGVVCKTATVYLSACAWCLWLEFFSGRRCRRIQTLCVYAKANIGKYLPGNVMHYVERNLFAGSLGLTQKQIAAASLLEAASLASAASLIGICLAFAQMKSAVAALLSGRLFFSESPSASWNAGVLGKGAYEAADAPLVWPAAAVLVCVAAVALCRLFCLRGKKGKRLVQTLFGSVVLYAAVLGILGLVLVFLYWVWAGMPKCGLGQVLFMTAAYSIAWVLGFLVPGAPGGIGVREMVLTVLLSPSVGRDAVVAVSILHRLVTVAGDFAAYLLRLVFDVLAHAKPNDWR